VLRDNPDWKLKVARDSSSPGEPGGRKEKILVAAADLVARRGYHSASLEEIGNAAGITGPGVYRHFERKSALLVALLGGVADELLVNAIKIVASGANEREVLDELIADQVRFALTKRALIQVYIQEIHNLPDEDRRSLRRKQRRYLEEWVNVLGVLRPEISYEEARSLVHAAISAIQSLLDYTSPLEPDQLSLMMTRAATAVLEAPVAPR
jgi:AcrR family transcriptional regulator